MSVRQWEHAKIEYVKTECGTRARSHRPPGHTSYQRLNKLLDASNEVLILCGISSRRSSRKSSRGGTLPSIIAPNVRIDDSLKSGRNHSSKLREGRK
jgi:hypothetical protein